MKKIFILISLAISSLLFEGCGESSINGLQSTIIGNQTWMTSNLNADKFRNGDAIPEVKTNEDWVKACENKQPAWCYYNNDSQLGETYGKLYNYYAIIDNRGLAPEGWHVPSVSEWNALKQHLGKECGIALKSEDEWSYSGDDIRGETMFEKWKGNNESGFNGLPGGIRFIGPIAPNGFKENWDFSGVNSDGRWWSTETDSKNRVICFELDNFHPRLDEGYLPITSGFSVRCVKD
jgi:uncharacterized protein (TIGR02145 family)